MDTQDLGVKVHKEREARWKTVWLTGSSDEEHAGREGCFWMSFWIHNLNGNAGNRSEIPSLGV